VLRGLARVSAHYRHDQLGSRTKAHSGHAPKAREVYGDVQDSREPFLTHPVSDSHFAQTLPEFLPERSHLEEAFPIEG
jgi:hypothetical protein